MTDPTNGDSPRLEPEPDAISPLPGEPGIPDVAARQRHAVSRKGLLAIALLLASLVTAAGLTVHRLAAGGKKAGEDSRRIGDRPTAATADPRRLDLLLPTTASAAATTPRIPAIVPADDEAEPIGVRRTGSASDSKTVAPEDAPVMVVTSRPGATASSRKEAAPGVNDADGNADSQDPAAASSRSLQGYQRQLQGLLDNLTRSTSIASQQAVGTLPASALPGNASAGDGLFGGQLQGSATRRVAASSLGNRSLTLPKGTAFTCALKTKVISATSGLVGCQVQRNVYGDDGRVLLIERGSHLDGEYRIASVRPGTVRIPVLWTRVRTPLGVTVDLNSPGTGALGESGVDGYVDKRWGERLGAAMLLSLIDDSVKLVIQNQAGDGHGDTIVLPSTTDNTSKLAEKVLDSTINIPPLVYRNQGGIVGIYVARDVDFSPVYALRPVDRGAQP